MRERQVKMNIGMGLKFEVHRKTRGMWCGMVTTGEGRYWPKAVV